MPSPLRVQDRYKKWRRHVEVDNDSNDSITVPTEADVQRIDNIINTLKPFHFSVDEETGKELTEEALLDRDDDGYEPIELD